MDLLRLQWTRRPDGYIVDEFPVFEPTRPEGDGVDRREFVVTSRPETSNDDDQTYEPLAEQPGLFRTFADTKASPDGALDFANRFGLLGIQTTLRVVIGPSADSPHRSVVSLAERVDQWLKAIRAMRRLCGLWDAGRRKDAAILLDAAIRNDERPIVPSVFFREDGQLKLTIRPSGLWTAMLLQAALAFAGNLGLRACAHCGRWFNYGTGTGRRNTALYCSGGCRSAAFNAAHR